MRAEHAVIFEFYRIGEAVKVSAVDPATFTEVSILGPASAGRRTLEEIAARKLHRALARAARKRRGGGRQG